jgi:hypothetical protein
MALLRISLLFLAMFTQAVIPAGLAAAPADGSEPASAHCGKSCCEAQQMPCHCSEAPASPRQTIPVNAPSSDTRDLLSKAARCDSPVLIPPPVVLAEPSLALHASDGHPVARSIRLSLLFCSILI